VKLVVSQVPLDFGLFSCRIKGEHRLHPSRLLGLSTDLLEEVVLGLDLLTYRATADHTDLASEAVV